MLSNSTYRVLIKEKEYRKLLCANIINRFGDSVDALAFSWLVYDLTGEASFMALTVALNYLPTILLQPFTGVLADRVKKQSMMVWCDIARGVTVAVAGALMLLGLLEVWMLIAMTVLNSVLEAFREPAGFAAMPLLLGEAHYQKATAMNSSLSRVSTLVGTAAAGGIIALFGTGGALIVDAATFFLSALVIAFIRFQEAAAPREKEAHGFFRDLREGVSYVWHSHILRALCVLGMLLNFLTVSFSIFAVPYVKDVMHADATLLSMVDVCVIVGTILGSLGAPMVKRLKGRTIVAAGGLLMGLGFSALYAVPGLPNLWALAAFGAVMLLIGISVGAISVTFSAAFMRHSDKALMGRLGGILSALLVAAIPLGSLIFSFIATFLSVRDIYLLLGALVTLLFLAMGRMKVYNEL